jgi:hypothetical protein
MKEVDDAAIAAVIKVRDSIDTQIERCTLKAKSVKAEYDNTLAKITGLRKKREVIEHTLETIGGNQPKSTVSEVELFLTEVLADGPKTLKQLQYMAEQRGINIYAIREGIKALPFTTVGAGRYTKYALRPYAYQGGSNASEG